VSAAAFPPPKRKHCLALRGCLKLKSSIKKLYLDITEGLRLPFSGRMGAPVFL
jgi:hypothetical protein